MGDMGDMFRDMEKDEQKRHADKYYNNMAIIENNLGGRYILKDTACLFRERNCPKVDFYPNTGRWKYNNKYYKGGAQNFVIWYLALI